MTITLTVAVFGWLWTLLIHSRELKRSEISKVKDKLIAEVTDMASWIIKSIQESESFTADDLEFLERKQAAQSVQIDTKIKFFNGMCKCNLIEEEKVVPFWNIDLRELGSLDRSSILEDVSDFIEHVEIVYLDHFFNMGFLERVWKTHRSEMLGFILVGVALYIFLLLVEWVVF